MNPTTDLHDAVRQHYGQIARSGGSCCAPSCCGPTDPRTTVTALGYSADEQAAAPEGANLGLGCGNPQAIASLRPGEVVLDLGSGAGFDCFLAAQSVGPTGRVIGVDMTPDMVARARANAEKSGLPNVEFRLGQIEHLPVADASVDVVISNCVVNLSPDKLAVYREAWRALRPGGRVAIADVVAPRPLSPEQQADVALHVGCVGGAASIDELTRLLTEAGFVDVSIREKEGLRELVDGWSGGKAESALVISANIEARKP